MSEENPTHTHSRHFISRATVLAAAMLLSGGIAQGVPTVNQLVITEISSNSLTATLDGSSSGLSITSGGADHWTITLSSSDSVSGQALWFEGTFNDVYASGHTLTVGSDLELPGPGGALSNGATDTNDFQLNGAPLDVTFNDNGDAVPDVTATLALLGVSLGGLAILAKCKKRQV